MVLYGQVEACRWGTLLDYFEPGQQPGRASCEARDVCAAAGTEPYSHVA